MNVHDEIERLDRLRLIRSQSVGPITFYRLMSRFGSASEAISALPHMAQRGGKKDPPRVMSVQEAENELKMTQNYGGDMVILGDEAYPEWLSTIEDAPPVLSIMGDASLLSKSNIGIVGARNASANAKRYTMNLARDLGQKGQIIASGMARGIDTAAHQASLETGTIAVMAGGIDQIYPNENRDLYGEIVKHGCIVSEMPFGTAPTAHHFPRRNRIVSGLSKGVVVVEASMRSGSLITARLAGEQGREVFAVPGFPGDPRAAGPNSLIQNGAKLIQNADDILEEIMAMDQKSIQPAQAIFDGIAEGFTDFEDTQITSDNDYELITQTLSSSPMSVDDLCQSCHLPIQNIQTCLMDLELAGVITRHPSNRVSKVA
jgi:DNA processing protein